MQPHKESALVKVDIDAEGVSVGYITEFNPIWLGGGGGGGGF